MERSLNESVGIDHSSEDVAIYIAPPKRMITCIAILMGLLAPTMMGYGLATSMVTIGRELGGIELMAWLFTAANLVQMVLQPLVSAISSKITLPKMVLIGMIISTIQMVGFLLAPNMGMLIAIRAVSGIAGAFLFTGGMALAGQIVPPEKRATIMGVQMTFNGAGAALGPFIAALACDAGNWRIWIVCQLVISVISLIAFIVLYPKGAKPETGVKFDMIGACLLAVMFVALACLLQLSGTYWEWASVITAILLTIFIATLVLFIKHELSVERTGGRPALRMSLFKQNAFIVAGVSAMLICIATNGLTTYIPSYAQLQIGMSVTQSSLGFTLSNIVCVIMGFSTGFVFGKKRWFKRCTTIGCGVIALAAIILTVLGSKITPSVYTILVIIGYGSWTAWISSVSFTIGQMLLPTSDILDATSGIAALQMIGAFLGVSLNATLINIAGYPALFMTCAVVLVAAIIVMLFLRDPEAKPVK